jgi:hypothetical protein
MQFFLPGKNPGVAVRGKKMHFTPMETNKKNAI